MHAITQGDVPTEARPAARPGSGRVWLWALLLLPLFFQLPYYKRDLGPLYALAKVWPLLVLPFALYGLLALRLPRAIPYVLFLAYALVVTPALSLLYLPNDVLDAALSTIRAWPILFYFAVPAALVLLRPSEKSVRHAALWVAAVTFAIMWLLWIVIPVAWYDATGLESALFTWDEGREYFIRMPMALGHVALFWLGRRFAAERRMWQAVLIVAALASLVLIYKARLPIGVTVLILGLAVFTALPPRLRLALVALGAIPLAAATMIYGPDVPAALSRAFDASLFIRLRSFDVAWGWIAEHPARLVFGTGSISTFSEISLAQVLGYSDFWITDIGWVGVIMEYGLVGTALIFMIYLRAYLDLRAATGTDPFRRALADFVLLEILSSAVYSVMYAPGPVATCAGIAWWLAWRDRMGLRDGERAPVAHPSDPPLPVPSWAAGSAPARNAGSA